MIWKSNFFYNKSFIIYNCLLKYGENLSIVVVPSINLITQFNKDYLLNEDKQKYNDLKNKIFNKIDITSRSNLLTDINYTHISYLSIVGLFEKLLDLLKSDDDKRNLFMKIRQAVADNHLNDYSEMYSMLYDKVDEYATGNVANTIMTIADGLSKDALVVDKEIVFMSTIIQILNIIK